MHDIVKIIQYFSELSSKVKLSNQLNLMDINILCENQVMRALNMLFDWKLYNANSKSQNTEALDLIDDNNHIAIQVTSNTRSSKIKETIDKAKKTPFADYQLYMFYLCDVISLQTKKAIEKYNIKALCFNDLVQGFYGNSYKTKEFIRQCVELTVYNKFREYLHYPNKWSYDDNFGGYYCDFDPNFKIKIEEYNESNKKYAWLCEIKAISKYYDNASMQYHSIALFYSDSMVFETISAGFYQEGLTIMMPNNLFFDREYVECIFEKQAKFFKCIFWNQTIFLGSRFNGVIFDHSKFSGLFILSSFVDAQKSSFTGVEIVDSCNVIKNLNKEEKEQLRASYKKIKAILLAQSNHIDALYWHRLELYIRELELDTQVSELCSKPIRPTWREKIDKWQLWFYRKTSDHHTDLLGAWNSLMCLVFIFSILSFGAMVWFACYFDKTFSISSLFDMRYLQVIYNSHISLLIYKHPYYIFGINFSFIAIFLSLFWISVFKYSRYFFVPLGYVTSIALFAISPKLLMPAIGFFTDKREVLDPLSIIGGIYTLLFGFLAYSFIKTARKNSIIPS